jgi:hypothetical protein
MTTPRIRKSIADLTVEDLRAHPIWESASDEEGSIGQDETTVRPYVGSIPANLECGLLALADFELADGTHHIGYVSAQPDAANNIGSAHPVIVCARGQIGFWYGAVRPGGIERRRSLSKLERNLEQVFPLLFRSRNGALVETIGGEVEGFMFLHDGKTLIASE